MKVEIIKQKINKEKLKSIAEDGYGDMVKVAADIEKQVLAIGGEFHSDCSEALIENGSEPRDIWGANIYINKPGSERIEFTALINIRPYDSNRSMEIQNENIKAKIRDIIDKFVE